MDGYFLCWVWIETWPIYRIAIFISGEYSTKSNDNFKCSHQWLCIKVHHSLCFQFETFSRAAFYIILCFLSPPKPDLKMQLSSVYMSGWRNPTVQQWFCSLVQGLWGKVFLHPFSRAHFEWIHKSISALWGRPSSIHRWLPASLQMLGLQIQCCP